MLRCGTSSIRLGPDRIEVTAKTLVLQGSGGRVVLGDDKVKIKAKSLIQGLSEDKIVLRSSGASVSLTADARIDGSSIKLKSPESASDADPTARTQVTKIELVDPDGAPIPHQRYVVVLGSGEERSGLLDQDGKADLELDEAATIRFPDLVSLETA